MVMQRFIKDENGVAMITVIGLMLVITTLAFGAIAVSQNDLLLSKRSEESMEALHIAEAGVQKAIWQLERLGNDDMQPRNFTIDVGNGTAQVTATQDSEKEWYWTIESIGTSGEAQRKLKVTVYNFSLWSMIVDTGDEAAGSGEGGLLYGLLTGLLDLIGMLDILGLENATALNGLFYIEGLLINFDNYESNTLVDLGGLVDTLLGGLGGLGAVAEDLLSGVGGLAGDLVIGLDSLLGLEGVGLYLAVDIGLDLPKMEPLLNYRELAASESGEASTAYPGIISVQTELNGYKVLDIDAGLAGGDPATRPTYYLNSATDSFGLETQEFAWDKANKKLYVNGTVFVDGNLVIGDNTNDSITYYGNGTLVVNGNVTINGKLRPPLDPVTSRHDMDAEHALGISTNLNVNIDAQGSGDPEERDPEIAAAIYAGLMVNLLSDNTGILGSLITSELGLSLSVDFGLFTQKNLPEVLPPSLPAVTGYMTEIETWREVD